MDTDAVLELIREVADQVAPSNDRDGVAVTLARLFDL